MADPETYDLIVIGAGPGGYVACVRAAQLGMRVACIEKESRLGGVCLNVGCIPSKALLDSSGIYHLAKERLSEYGVHAGEVSFDLAAMMARKERVINELANGIVKLLDGNRVTVIRGLARLVGERSVEVSSTGQEASGGSFILKAESILLATGSEPATVPGLPFDGTRIVSSTEALSFSEVPKRLGIIGGGYIGLELGSLWRRLGAEVTVIEMLPKIAASLDGQVGRTLHRVLAKQGLEFKLNTKVLEAVALEDGVRAVLQSESGTEDRVFDRLLVAVGRRPLTKGLGLQELGVKLDARTGHVLVDEQYCTSVPGIYAIGDLIPGPMLAHKASAEGVAAAECIAGLPGEVNYDAVPAVIYTSPEVASVGLTEEQLKERGVSYCVGTYSFAGNGRARCLGETEGFVKIIAHAGTSRVLGVHIIGSRAEDIIAECVLALELGVDSEAIAGTIHGHPTFSEALHEAALAVRKCSIHAL